MNVPTDLKNVYIHEDVKKVLPILQSKMTLEGKRGRKFAQLSLGDAASYAIMEACERRGITLTPAELPTGDEVIPVPVVTVSRKARVKA